MTRIRLVQILLDSNGVYFPGQTVAGKISIDLADELHVRDISISCKGVVQTFWTSGSGKSRRHHGYGVEILDKTLRVLGLALGQLACIPAGEQSYGFQFPLPDPLPMSYEGRCGYIKYWLKACIKREDRLFSSSDVEVTLPFAVDNLRLDLNSVENVRIPVVSQEEDIPCCSFDNRPIHATLRLDRTGFTPGETIKFDAEIDNRSVTDVFGSAIKLFQVTTYRTRGVSCKVFRERLGPGVAHGRVRSRDSCSYLRQRLPVPANLTYTTGQPGSDLIDVQYTVEFHVHTDCSAAIDIVVPITIGSIPLIIGQSPSTERHVVYTDPPDYNTCAIESRQPSGSTENISAAEDILPSYAEVMGDGYTLKSDGPSQPERFISANTTEMQDSATWIEQLPSDGV